MLYNGTIVFFLFSFSQQSNLHTISAKLLGAFRGGSSVGAGGAQAPPTPTNSMESRGKKEGEEEERKEGGRRKGGLEEEEGK